MLRHGQSAKNPRRYNLLKIANKRFENEGLNSVKYILIKKNRYKMFTHFRIDVGNPPREITDSIWIQNITRKLESNLNKNKRKKIGSNLKKNETTFTSRNQSNVKFKTN